MEYKQKKEGFALVELIVVLGMATVFFFSTMQFISTSVKVMRAERFTREAGLLLAEANDGVKFMRDAGWSAYIIPLSLETNYYLVPSGNAWSLSLSSPGPIVNLYTRTIVFHQVLRDGNNNIVLLGGIADANSRGVTTKVIWQGFGGTRTLTNDFYVNNILRN